MSRKKYEVRVYTTYTVTILEFREKWKAQEEADYQRIINHRKVRTNFEYKQNCNDHEATYRLEYGRFQRTGSETDYYGIIGTGQHFEPEKY